MASTSLGVTRGITRLHLYDLLCREKLIGKANRISSIARMVDYASSQMPRLRKEAIERKIKVFASAISRLWSANRKKDAFVNKYQDWLQEELWPAAVFQDQDAGEAAIVQPARPDVTPVLRKKKFVMLSVSAKRKRMKKLVTDHSPEELSHAAQTSYIKTGKRNKAAVIKIATTSSPRSIRAIKRRNVLKKKISPYTPEEALALIINAKLNVDQYKQLRKGAKERGCDIYPSYDRVLIARKECYPEETIIKETKAEVKLQSLLDHTVQRLAKVQQEVIAHVVIDTESRFFLKSKWGFDGSTSQSEYKQTFTEDVGASDADILLTSLVPLQLIMKTEQSETIIWQNPRPSSTRFCRPIRYQFLKESFSILKQEDEYISRQIDALTPTQLNIGGKIISVEHLLIETMLDGKAANALSDNKSSQTCNICKATPKYMNDIDAVLKRPCNKDLYSYGLSTLHAHIRLFECVLHLAYRLDAKVWRVQADVKQGVDKIKQFIIDEYRRQTGLLIDMVEQGSGSTNDGNTARTFFEHPDLAAQITKVDRDLIVRFTVILKTLSCSYEVNPEAFKEYALETARLFVEKYEWFKMPASVHKILIHGADVIESLVLPIGQLSEEALESRHKDCRYYRQYHTRKIGRTETIADLLHALLVSSDPLISSIRPLPKRNISTLSPELWQEVLKLLKGPKDPSGMMLTSEVSDNEDQ